MADLVKKIRTASGDLQIDYNALANLPALNNNLLINSDFRNPVNQRGKSIYTYNGDIAQYTVDRWRAKGVNVAVGDSSITVKNRSGSANSVFCQPFENNLITGTYTVTIGCQNVVGTVYVCLNENGENKKLLSNGVNTFTFASTSSASGLYLLFGASDNEEGLNLYYIKLEQGVSATPLVYKSYAEELRICERYYEESHMILIPMNLTGTTKYFMAINGGDYKTTKRTSPTVTFKSFIDNASNEVSVVVAGYTSDPKSFKRVAFSEVVAETYLLTTIYADAEIY